MNRHTERYIAWKDPVNTGWKVIDLETDDPATASGKHELAGVRSYETAHSLAMEMERT